MPTGKYIDPFTDFGFKRLFGTESNKDLLIEFLNVLLKGRKTIRDLTFANNEQMSKTPDARKAFFDLYCVADNGERFIVELQRMKQQYFRDRAIYYATYPLHEEGQKGDVGWDYRLPEIFLIGIMDFTFEHSPKSIFYHQVQLMELTTKEVFYDKLTFIFLEMPKFEKREDELETSFDKWMFLLKHLKDLQDPPSVLEEKNFQKIFKIASIMNLNKEEMNAYEASLKQKRDWNSALAYAVEEAVEKALAKGEEKGRAEGLEEGLETGRELGLETAKRTFALKLKKKCLSTSEISNLMDLSEKEVNDLLQ
jgi:predicted transposase/invertase (TIGR01784 family)